MRALNMKTPLFALAISAPLIVAAGATADIVQIIDAAGDGFGGNPLDRPRSIFGSTNATQSRIDVYVAGGGTDNGFRIDRNLQVAAIIRAAGDGVNPLTNTFGAAGDTLFAWFSGTNSDNVFRNRGSNLELINAGDGLDAPFDLALSRDGLRTSYVAGGSSDNAYLMNFDGTVVTELINSTGDGINPLDFAFGIDVDLAGNVYVTGASSDNAFRIAAGDGAITQIIDSTGDGNGNALARPFGIAVADDGTAYVTGTDSDNAFRIDPDGTVTQIIDSTGNGAGTLDRPFGIGVDRSGVVYVAGSTSDNVFRIEPDGTTCIVIDATGNGQFGLDGAEGISVLDEDPLLAVYVTGPNSDNAFRIDGEDLACPVVVCPEDLDGSGAVDFGDILAVISAWGEPGGPEDLDGSGTVDFGDLVIVLGAWGPCE